MKVTNDLIDKVTEVCMDVALKVDRYYEDVLREFLRDYLNVPFTLLSAVQGKVKEAKGSHTQEQWQDAYRRYCQVVYGRDYA